MNCHLPGTWLAFVAMVDSAGETNRTLGVAGAALAAGDEALAAADRVLAQTLATARATAVESVRRIDVVRAGVDAVIARGAAGSPAEAGHLAGAVASGHREVIAAVTEARSVSSANATVLRDLSSRYRSAVAAGLG